MEITKLSTKGQVVIPEAIRQHLAVGTAFAVFRKNNIIILKEIEGLTNDEQEEFKELNNIWKDIDAGKGVTKSRNEFLREMETW